MADPARRHGSGDLVLRAGHAHALGHAGLSPLSPPRARAELLRELLRCPSPAGPRAVNRRGAGRAHAAARAGTSSRDSAAGLMAYLFDTNAMSELLKPRPAAGYVRWLAPVPREEQFSSAVVVGELYKGAVRSSAVARHLGNIEKRVLPAVTVLSHDVPAARVYGQIRAQLESSGRPLADVQARTAIADLLRAGGCQDPILTERTLTRWQALPECPTTSGRGSRSRIR